jgi:hypothetical protein
MRAGFKVTPSLHTKINKLAKAVGCPLNWRRKPGIQWNGKDSACKGEDASNIIHDIAHYALATDQERACPDFGLGPSPSSNSDEDIKAIYRDSKCDKIERQASALGIYWEQRMGLPWMKTAEYHSWTSRYGRNNDDLRELKDVWRDMKAIIDKYDRVMIWPKKKGLSNEERS